MVRMLVSTHDAADGEVSDRLLKDSVISMPQDVIPSPDLVLSCFAITFNNESALGFHRVMTQ